MTSEDSYVQKVLVHLSIPNKSSQNGDLPAVNQEGTTTIDSYVLKPEGSLNYYYRPEPPSISTLPKPKRVGPCSHIKIVDDKWFLMFLLMSCCFLASLMAVSWLAMALNSHHHKKPKSLPRRMIKVHFKPDTSENDTDTKNVPKRRVVVDPGFGGAQNGRTGADGAVISKEINLNIGLKVTSYLDNKGYEVKLTRSSDIFVALTSRAEMANMWKADLFVSVHTNGSRNKTKNGIYVWYNWQCERAKILATIMATEVSAITGASNQGVKTWGEFEEDFTVLAKTGMSAVLILGGFVSNENEVKKLQDDKYLDKIAIGISNAVETYMDAIYKF